MQFHETSKFKATRTTRFEDKLDSSGSAGNNDTLDKMLLDDSMNDNQDEKQTPNMLSMSQIKRKGFKKTTSKLNKIEEMTEDQELDGRSSLKRTDLGLSPMLRTDMNASMRSKRRLPSNHSLTIQAQTTRVFTNSNYKPLIQMMFYDADLQTWIIPSQDTMGH